MTKEQAVQIEQESGFEEVIDQLIEEGWNIESKDHLEERTGIALSHEYDNSYVYVDDMGMNFVISDMQDLLDFNILD